MSNEIVVPYTTGATVYAFVVSATGQFWNTSGTPAFEAFSSAHWSVYAISLTESGSSGLYFGNFPAVVAGTYSMLGYKRAGGTPAIGDLLVANEYNFGWDGSKQVTQSDVREILGTASAGVAGYTAPDWSHVNAPTTTVNLSGTTIATSQVVASVSGAVGSVTGAVGSVTGAVGSVTGNVGGNVVGSVASVSGNVGGNVVGSVGSISGITFPTNFSVLAIAATTGQVGINWGNILNPTTTQNLSNTKISTTQTIANVTVGGYATGQDPATYILTTPANTIAANASNQVVASSVQGVVTGDVQGKVLGGGASAFTAVGVQADLQTIKTQTVTCAAGVTVNVNVGTTQPLNFTGTAGSALVKSDMVDIAGVAVSATTAQLGVNIVNIKGTASAGAAGYVGPDWGNVNAPTSTVNLSGTTISTSQAVASVTGSVGSVAGDVVGKVLGGGVSAFTAVGVQADVQTIKTQAITAAGGITFPAATLASTTNITAGTITTTTNLTNLPSIPTDWLTGAGIAASATAKIATAILTDTTAGDFAVSGSPGKILVTQLGGTFTTASSSIFTATALQNAPVTAAAPTTAQIATAIFTDLLSSSDFSTAGSIGALLKANTVIVGSYAGGQAPLQPTVAGRTLDVSTGGAAGVDWANVESPTTTVNLSGTTISTGQKVGLTLPDSPIVSRGTVQAAGASSITLEPTEPSTNSYYVGSLIKITSGTGLGQTRVILSYAGSTQIATVQPWIVTPDGTSAYAIVADYAPNVTSTLAIASVAGSVGSISGITFPTNFSVLAIAATTGQVGINWGNVLNPTATQGLSGTTIGTLTTYTGNTPQTGDSFARIGATGSGLTSLAPAATALSTVQWTNARAAKLDNLDATVSSRSTYAGGAVASVTAPVTVGGYSTGQDPATKTWNAVAASFDVAGSMGAVLNSLGSGSLQVVLAADGLDNVIIESASGDIPDVNARQALAMIMDAAPMGLISGVGTAAVTVKNPGGNETRLVATVDTLGNRLGFTTFNPPA